MFRPGFTPGFRGRRLLGGELELRGGLLALEVLDKGRSLAHGQVVEFVVEHFCGHGVDLLFGNALPSGDGLDCSPLGVRHGRILPVDPGRRSAVSTLGLGARVLHRGILAAFPGGVLPSGGFAPGSTAEVGIFQLDVGRDADVGVGPEDPGQGPGRAHPDQMLGHPGAGVLHGGIPQIAEDLAFRAGQGCSADRQVPILRAGELNGFHFQGADAHGVAQIEQARVLHELPAFDGDDEPGVKGGLGFGTGFITSAFRGHWGPSFLSSVSPGCPGRSFRPPGESGKRFGRCSVSCMESFPGKGGWSGA